MKRGKGLPAPFLKSKIRHWTAPTLLCYLANSEIFRYSAGRPALRLDIHVYIYSMVQRITSAYFKNEKRQQLLLPRKVQLKSAMAENEILFVT